MTTTYVDGWRNEVLLVIGGLDATRKAQATGAALLERIGAMLAARGLEPFDETLVEVLGADPSLMAGPAAAAAAANSNNNNNNNSSSNTTNNSGGSSSAASRFSEVVLKLSAKHPRREALELLAREFAPAATSMAPGTMPLVPGRPRPAPLVRVFSSLVDKARVPVQIAASSGGPPVDGPAGAGSACRAPSGSTAVTAPRRAPYLYVGAEAAAADAAAAAAAAAAAVVAEGGPAEDTVTVPLVRLCLGRSGDKGDVANVGLVARRPEYLPLLRGPALGEPAVARWLGHLLVPGESTVARHEAPGLGGLNLVLTRALGGGGTSSLRTDALAKAVAQQLLAMPVAVPRAWFPGEAGAAAPP